MAVSEQGSNTVRLSRKEFRYLIEGETQRNFGMTARRFQSALKRGMIGTHPAVPDIKMLMALRKR